MRLTRNRALAFLAVMLGPPSLAMVMALAFNAYVDPYWIMPTLGERSGIRYCVDDERQNKINKMIYGGANADSVLIGSSRSAFFDTRYFHAKVFNLAVDGLSTIEFPEYLRMFSQYVGTPKDIYIGFDFFGYLQEANNLILVERAREKERISNKAGYRQNLLFDLGSFQKSLSTLTECSASSHENIPTHRYDGVRLVGKAPRNPDILKQQLKFFADLYKKPVDPNFLEHIEQLKRVTADSKLHAYIPPISAELYETLVAAGRAEDYKKWLAILVGEFGSVIQFSGINSFTTNPENFYDAHHTYPDLTEKMIAILEGRRAADDDGFGKRITDQSSD
jgi:hypothetical protein